VTYRYLDTPVGDLLLARDAAGLRLIHFVRAGLKGADLVGTDHVGAGLVGADLQVGPSDVRGPDWQHEDTAFDDVVSQLTEYFDGRRRQFDLPLAPAGTPFQQRVWRALLDVPYGETISYGELASRIGQRSASRAVGLANGSNPLPIVIPCHRVIGSNGKLTGYGGGLPIKERLLAHERGDQRLL
jgi:methylated-DNA-[protein]-cysteine S-methyltransferase